MTPSSPGQSRCQGRFRRCKRDKTELVPRSLVYRSVKKSVVFPTALHSIMAPSVAKSSYDCVIIGAGGEPPFSLDRVVLSVSAVH
jgi:hypothetical protein